MGWVRGRGFSSMEWGHRVMQSGTRCWGHGAITGDLRLAERGPVLDCKSQIASCCVSIGMREIVFEVEARYTSIFSLST